MTRIPWDPNGPMTRAIAAYVLGLLTGLYAWGYLTERIFPPRESRHELRWQPNSPPT